MRIAVRRDPMDRLWSLLRLHTRQGSRWSAADWQQSLGLLAWGAVAPIAEPLGLARALLWE